MNGFYKDTAGSRNPAILFCAVPYIRREEAPFPRLKGGVLDDNLRNFDNQSSQAH